MEEQDKTFFWGARWAIRVASPLILSRRVPLLSASQRRDIEIAGF